MIFNPEGLGMELLGGHRYLVKYSISMHGAQYLVLSIDYHRNGTGKTWRRPGKAYISCFDSCENGVGILKWF